MRIISSLSGMKMKLGILLDNVRLEVIICNLTGKVKLPVRAAFAQEVFMCSTALKLQKNQFPPHLVLCEIGSSRP